MDIICVHKEWVEEDSCGIKYNFSGWELRVVHDNYIETQWYLPSPEDSEAWETIRRYGGSFVCPTGDGRSNFIFETEESGLAFIDDWLMPRLIPRIMAGENLNAGKPPE